MFLNETILIVCIFATSIIHGIAGFGFGLLSIPILSFFYDIKTSIIIATYLTFISYIGPVVSNYKTMKIKSNIGIILFIFIGMLFGIFIFKEFNEKFLRLITGGLIIIFGILLLGNFLPSFKNFTCSKSLFGLISGALMTSCGMGGPPIVVYFSSLKLSINQFRANVLPIFFIMTGIAAIMYAINDNQAKLTIFNSFKLLPSLVIGSYLGILLIKKINSRIFSVIVNFLIILSGFTLLL